MITSFRESVEALKETWLADSAILKIMSNSIDNQLNGSRSIPKTNLNNPSNKAERALLQEDSNNNVQTPTVIKRRGGGVPLAGTRRLESKKHLEKVHLGIVRKERRLLSIILLFLSPNKIFFSANIHKDPKLVEKAFNVDFPDSQKRHLKRLKRSSKSLLKALLSLFFFKKS